MARRYLNQGHCGEEFSSLLVETSWRGGEHLVKLTPFADGIEGNNIILDVEQVANLIAYLQDICPTPAPKAAKIIDE